MEIKKEITWRHHVFYMKYLSVEIFLTRYSTFGWYYEENRFILDQPTKLDFYF